MRRSETMARTLSSGIPNLILSIQETYRYGEVWQLVVLMMLAFVSSLGWSSLSAQGGYSCDDEVLSALLRQY